MKTFYLLLSFCTLTQAVSLAQNPADRDSDFDMLLPLPFVHNAGNSLNRRITVQPDGKVLFYGNFAHYSFPGLYSGVVRLNTDGSYDEGFNANGAGAAGIVASAAVQDDDKIILGGGFSTFNGESSPGLVRLNPNGSIDESFDVGLGAQGLFIYLPYVRSIVIQPDGKILIAGTFTSYNDNPCPGVARLNADGSFDSSFNTGEGPNNAVESIALQPDGKIIAGGRFGSFAGHDTEGVARLNSDGSPDLSFTADVGVSTNTPLYEVILQPDGKILAAGLIDNGIVRLLPDGSPDPGFDVGAGPTVGSTNGFSSVNGTELLANGQIMVAGPFSRFDLVDCGGLARLNSDGSLDPTFDAFPGFDGGMPVQVKRNTTDHKLYITCLATHYRGEDLFNNVTQFSGHFRDVIRIEGSAILASTARLKAQDLKLYPNPTSDFVHIELPESLSANTVAHIHDISGKLVYSRVLNSSPESTLRLDLHSLSNGLYIITLEGNGELYRSKLTIHRL